MRYPILLGWLTAVALAVLSLPSLSASGGVGDLLPTGSRALRAEADATTLFRVPLILYFRPRASMAAQADGGEAYARRYASAPQDRFAGVTGPIRPGTSRARSSGATCPGWKPPRCWRSS